jgi:hypothetical protein
LPGNCGNPPPNRDGAADIYVWLPARSLTFVGPPTRQFARMSRKIVPRRIPRRLISCFRSCWTRNLQIGSALRGGSS